MRDSGSGIPRKLSGEYPTIQRCAPGQQLPLPLTGIGVYTPLLQSGRSRGRVRSELRGSVSAVESCVPGAIHPSVARESFAQRELRNPRATGFRRRASGGASGLSAHTLLGSHNSWDRGPAGSRHESHSLVQEFVHLTFASHSHEGVAGAPRQRRGVRRVSWLGRGSNRREQQGCSHAAQATSAASRALINHKVLTFKARFIT
jgi:hypothetical protein